LDNGLRGSLPSSFGNLLGLTTLSFNHNKLNGTIPASIGNLVQLTLLDLTDNSLTGTIPASLGKLKQLTDVGLYTNLLTGLVPSLPFAQWTDQCALDSCVDGEKCNQYKCPLPANAKGCIFGGISTEIGVHCK